MKVYLTKYALSSGIKECEVEKYNPNTHDVYLKGYDTSFGPSNYGATLKEAQEMVLVMRDNKVKSLQK